MSDEKKSIFSHLTKWEKIGYILLSCAPLFMIMAIALGLVFGGPNEPTRNCKCNCKCAEVP